MIRLGRIAETIRTKNLGDDLMEIVAECSTHDYWKTNLNPTVNEFWIPLSLSRVRVS